MAVHYRWNDDGSPGRTLAGNQIDRLKTILKACLVTGYGTKPGAGWSMVHEHASGFSLTNASRTGILNIVVGPLTWYFHVYALESVTDSSGAILVGENLRSGDYYPASGSDSGNRHGLYVDYLLGANLGTLNWCIVADGESFVLSMQCGRTDQYGRLSLYAGRCISDQGLSGASEFVVLGGGYGTKTSANQGYPFTSGYTQLRNPMTGLLGNSLVRGYPFGLDITQKGALTGALPKYLSPQQARVNAENGFPGRLRGVLYDDLLFRYNYQASLRALGLPEVIDSCGQMVTVDGLPLAVGDGYYGTYFLTTAPEYW